MAHLASLEVLALASLGASVRVHQREPGGLGLVLEGLDLRRVESAAAEELKQLMYHHKLVAVRDQPLTEQEFIDLARKLGRPIPYFQDHYHHPCYPEIFVSASAPLDNQKIGVSRTGQFWHSDYSFMPEPLSFTLIRPKLLPKSPRTTLYIDMERVYAALPTHLRDYCDTRRAFHEVTNYYKIQPWDRDKAICEVIAEVHAEAPGTWHPMVIEHPVTGARALYVSRGFTTAVEGLTHEETQGFLDELFEFVERSEHVETYTWQPDDLLMWDNRELIHHAGSLPKSEQSISFRISVNDGLSFY